MLSNCSPTAKTKNRASTLPDPFPFVSKHLCLIVVFVLFEGNRFITTGQITPEIKDSQVCLKFFLFVSGRM